MVFGDKVGHSNVYGFALPKNDLFNIFLADSGYPVPTSFL
jgi:hypothetical protein|tara:strand:+ start:116 stop:235 length:120 start_codon:yes stop_codon:yes gene_type:complete